MNEQLQWRDALSQYIRLEALPVEKFGHQPRLYGLTKIIGRGLEYDDDVIYAAAYLHDLGVFLGHRPDKPVELARWDHVAYATQQCPSILHGIGFPQGKLSKVIESIQNHQPHNIPRSIESTILRDADILEQLGAVGILRTVCKVGRDTRYSTFTDAVQALQVALQTLPAAITLPATRILAEEKIVVLRQWLEAVEREAGVLLL